MPCLSDCSYAQSRRRLPRQLSVRSGPLLFRRNKPPPSPSPSPHPPRPLSSSPNTSRCSFTGFDLNRCWNRHQPIVQPTITATKEYLMTLMAVGSSCFPGRDLPPRCRASSPAHALPQIILQDPSMNLAFFVDLHAHSTLTNGTLPCKQPRPLHRIASQTRPTPQPPSPSPIPTSLHVRQRVLVAGTDGGAVGVPASAGRGGRRVFARADGVQLRQAEGGHRPAVARWPS